MEHHNFAAYKTGSFAVDTSNLQLDEGGFYRFEDIPALVHEYCHYIQDISQISSINGFSLWMRDVVALTHIFANGEGKSISIPLPKDAHGDPADKHRKFYSLYCGDSDQVLDWDFSKLTMKEPSTTIEKIQLDGMERSLAVNYIYFKERQERIHFGLIALQEIQAYYAQKLAEQNIQEVCANRNKKPIEFSKTAESLSPFPYKFGDYLFDFYSIDIDLKSKFILADLCLNTIQAPTVFLNALKHCKGKKYSFSPESILELTRIVEDCRKQCSHSNKVALDQMLPDLKIWANDNRKYFSTAIDWYVNIIELCINLEDQNPIFFSMPFCMGLESFAQLYNDFPVPVFINAGKLNRNAFKEDEEKDQESILAFDAATTIWSHKVIFDLLCSKTLKDFRKNTQCPWYDKCEKRPQIGNDYICSASPWEIIKDDKGIHCHYGMAAHSMGIWQNTLEINLPEEK